MQPNIIDKWVLAVNNGTVEEIMEFYADQSILIPTFSESVSDSKEKIETYFERLRKKKNLSVEIHSGTVKSQNVQAGIEITSGIYSWKFELDGAMISQEARFSFVIDQNLKHPILHHHSSQVPRML